MDKYLTKSSSNESLSGKRPLEDNRDWRKPKRPSLKTRSPGITAHLATSNRFQDLPAEDDGGSNFAFCQDTTTTGKPKNIKVPPIIIQLNKEWTHKTINDLITLYTKTYHIKYRGNNSIAIYCYSNESHKLLTDGLRKEEILYHTFTRKDEKLYKVVLRGLPASAIEDVAGELSALGFKDVTVTKLTKKENITCPPILLKLPPGVDIVKLKQTKYLCNCVVEFLKYRPNNTYGTQCFRCQRFGHSSMNCNLPPRCVKCTKSHATKDCDKKDRSEMAQCCNCNEKHPANFRQCPERQKYLRKIVTRTEKAKEPVIQPHRVKRLQQVDQRTWAQVASSSTTEPVKTNSTIKEDERIASDSSQFDSVTKEMLQILSVIKSVKDKFTACPSMMEKVILVLSHLGRYV